jgi:hypothetical protein
MSGFLAGGTDATARNSTAIRLSPIAHQRQVQLQEQANGQSEDIGNSLLQNSELWAQYIPR